MKLLNISSLNRDSSGIHNPNSLFTSSGLGINITVIATSGVINDLDTTDISSIKLTNATELSGLAGGGNGKLVILINGSGDELTILNDSETSELGNRIYTGTDGNVILPPNASLLLQYDPDSTHWIAIGGTGGGGGGTTGTVLDTYITSKAVEITDDSTSSINTIFEETVSGIYTFWVSSDPRIKGIISLNSSDINNTILESLSESVSFIEDRDNSLNVYVSSGDIIFQNKLGSTVTIAIKRETTPNSTGGGSSISSHNDLSNLQGGSSNAYYHSNQQINTTNAVTFAGMTIPLVTESTSGTLSDIITTNIGGYRFTSATTTTITGFANGSNGKILYLHNASSLEIIIANASTSSTGVNRILTGSGKDLKLKPEASIVLQYDSTTSRWRILGGSGGGGNSGEDPQTIDLSNTNATIDLSTYSTTSLRVKNPAQITLSNGSDGVWYTLAIVSDGTYSFTSEVRFPLDNAQPIPSANTRIDVYTLHCINTTDGLKYLATFAYDYSGVTLP